MVWKPFVLGDCVPCAGSRLKNPLSFYCFHNSQFRQLGVRNGYQLFVLPTRAITIEPKVVIFAARNTNIYKICQLRRAIFSSFYNNFQPNFAILLILRRSYQLW